MTNSRVHALLALGSVAVVGALAVLLPPVPPASAQSQAERMCREQGFSPRSEGHEHCVAYATRALEWGEPALARSLARMTVSARDACLEHGLKPATSGFRSCLERETHARSLLIFADQAPKYGPQVADQL